MFVISRVIHARRWHGGGWGGGCGWRHRGWHGGPHGHHWGRRGWGGGFGPDDDDSWGATFRDGGGPEAWGGDIRGKRFFIRSLLSHVDATPAQERAIGAAFEEFRGDVKKLGGGGETRRSRQEIADALRQPTFDGVVLGEQFARHDTVIEGARKAFVGLVARVHDTLEPEQRTRLATLVERGPRFGWWQ